MTKTLTEQWRDGTLRGCFYWKLPNGNICMAYTDTMREMKNVRDSDEVEVLQEAPSYYEWKRLQEQLKEANKIILDVSDYDPINPTIHEISKVINRCNAREYLEKWGVK